MRLTALAVGTLCFASIASAQTFTSSQTASFPYASGAAGAQANLSQNLNTFPDWAYYIYGGETIVDGPTSAFNPVLTFGTASTTSNSLGYGTGYQKGSLGTNGDPGITYVGGYQTNYTSVSGSTPTTVGSTSGDDAKTNEGLYAGTPNGGSASLQTISGMLTLTAPTESLTFTLDENDTAADMAFTLKNPQTNVTTAFTVVGAISNGGNDNFDALTVNITGAAAGDTLNFTESAEANGFNTTYAHIGIVSAVAFVPEPSSYALMLGGAAALFGAKGLLRRRNRLN